MSVPNVTAGQPITEAWGDAVADSVNALEGQMALTASDAELAAHAAAADPHTGYALDADVTAAVAAHVAAGDPHSAYATDADLSSHAGAADPHTGYQKESEKGAASGYAGLDGSGKVPAAQLPAAGSGMVQTLNAIFDGAGAVIAAGRQLDVQLDFAGTITKWTALADQSGSITVNVWKDTYANFPPTSADLLGSPAISGATKAQSGAISWAFAAGDILRLNVAATPATIQRCTIALTITRT